MIEFSVSGIADVNRMLGPLCSIKPYEALLKEVTLEAFYLTRKYAPEDTSKMFKHIYYYRDSPTEWTIRVDVPYAVYNEYGTIKMPAGTPESPLAVTSRSGKLAFRPFVRPALLQAQRKIPEIFNRVFLK